MKKLFFVFLFSGSLFASSLNHKGKKLEFYAGPSLDVRNNTGSQVVLGSKFGGDTLGGALDLAIGNLNTIKPKFVFDIMYYYKNNELVMGPTFDIGPSFIFNTDVFLLKFFELGAGYRIMYELTNAMGVIFTPVHLTTSFFGWGNGGRGLDTGFWLSYEMYFSLYWLL